MIAYLADTPEFFTERLRIRAPKPGDVEQFVPFAMDDRSVYIRGEEPCDLGRAWRIFATVCGHWQLRGYGSFIFADRETDRAIGSAGPWFPGDWPEKEFGWTVWSAADEGQGYAFEAMQAIRAHVYAHLGWTTAVSYIAHGNTRSRALAVRLGCRLDDAAPLPRPDEPTWVFRHPGPEELQ